VIDYALKTAQFRTPRGVPVPMTYREETSDWNTITACMTEDEYGLRARIVAGLAFDIGAHVGGVAIGLAIDNPELEVVAVEPVPDNVALLRRNVSQNGLDGRITVIAGAVGDGQPVEIRYRYRGTETAEHHAFIGNSSLAYDSGGELAHETTTYTSRTIATLWLEFGIPDFVKIDTEGAEWAFLAENANSLPYITGEWHPVRGHTQDDFRALLERSHDITFSGPIAGPGGFEAIRRG
jgi:FkbM family methyltransferase